MPGAFVLWAAEYIRSSFPGGQLTWAFVFQGLGLPEDRDLGVRLVVDGLRWWRRRVRLAEGGQRMFLYSLMAEGGLPEALLAQEGLYRRVVLGLLEEMEAEGGAEAAPIAERMAARWVAALPQTFRTADFARLLAELTLALARLRALIPEDLSGQAAEHWLNYNQPGWDADLPLRMSPAIAEQLIRPALGGERRSTPSAGPLATRELCRDDGGCWRWFVRLRDEGFLPEMQLPDAEGLRLRLLPTGAAAVNAEAVVWAATPDQKGWQVRRIGRTGGSLMPLAPDVPFVLGAFADGRPRGEVVVTAGLPDACVAPTLWRAADPADGADAVRLVAQPGTGKARAACLWVLGPETVSAAVHGCIAIVGPEPVAGGRLWRVSGQGMLSFGSQHRFEIETSAAEEAPEARLVPVGRVLSVWRTERDRGLVYCGRPQILGEMGAAGLRLLPDRALRFVQIRGRALAEQMVEWVDKGEVLTRLRLTSLPQETRLSITEETAGRLRLAAAGLQQGVRLSLRGGAAEARADLANGRGEIVIDVTGAPPGQVALRLTDIDSGAGLHLIAPWPARSGLILDPNGNRLERDTPIAADALRGWRAVVPEGAMGELAMGLVGHPVVAVSAAGEVPLHSYLPLIRAMLAQGGPDAQVNLNLIVQGREGKRLEVRRYQDQVLVEGDELRTGLARGTRAAPKTALAAQLDRRPVTLHAVDLTIPGKSVVIEAVATRNLRMLLARKIHEIGRPALAPPGQRNSRL
jgi:hypothetical protein